MHLLLNIYNYLQGTESGEKPSLKLSGNIRFSVLILLLHIAAL